MFLTILLTLAIGGMSGSNEGRAREASHVWERERSCEKADAGLLDGRPRLCAGLRAGRTPPAARRGVRLRQTRSHKPPVRLKKPCARGRPVLSLTSSSSRTATRASLDCSTSERSAPEDIPACRLSEHGSFHRLCRRLLSTVVQPFSPGGSSAEPVQSRDSSWDKSFQLAFLIRNAHIASGRLARDVSLANRVRSGRKQP